MHWSADYIDIPWKKLGRTREEGVDCWGLLRIWASDRGLELPEFVGGYWDAQNDLHEAVKLDENKITQGSEQDGDVILFRNKLHVGIVTRPGRMLHTVIGVGTAIEVYRSTMWLPRLKTIVRLFPASQ